MKRKITISFLIAVFSFSVIAFSAEKIEHFKGEPAETLEQAVTNFSEYNKKLSEILNKDELTDQDMVKIHQFTYTLENALGKINSDLDELAVKLEELHVSSEQFDQGKVRKHGFTYLNTARTIIQ